MSWRMKARRMCCMAPGHSKTGERGPPCVRKGQAQTGPPSFSGCRRGRPPWRRALPFPLGGEGRHLVQPGSDAAFPGGKGAGPTGSGGAARPSAVISFQELENAAQRIAVAGRGRPCWCCHFAAGHPVLRGPWDRQGAGPGTWAAAWDAFWLGWPWFLCWARTHQLPSSLLPRAISLLGATTATCSSLAEEGWQLSRKMPAARSSSTSWGSGSGEAMLLLAGGAALLCLLLVTMGMYLRRSSGFHARGGPSFFFPKGGKR